MLRRMPAPRESDSQLNLRELVSHPACCRGARRALARADDPRRDQFDRLRAPARTGAALRLVAAPWSGDEEPHRKLGHRRTRRRGLSAHRARAPGGVVILDVPLGNYVSSVYTASADWRVKAPPTAWSVFSRRPAAVDEVRAFAAGILGRERFTPLHHFAFAATSAGAGAIRNDTALALNTAISFTTYDDQTARRSSSQASCRGTRSSRRSPELGSTWPSAAARASEV